MFYTILHKSFQFMSICLHWQYTFFIYSCILYVISPRFYLSNLTPLTRNYDVAFWNGNKYFLFPQMKTEINVTAIHLLSSQPEAYNEGLYVDNGWITVQRSHTHLHAFRLRKPSCDTINNHSSWFSQFSKVY